MNDFAEKLRKLRDSGMKAAEMARITGRSRASFHHWLQGRLLPGHEKQGVILKTLGLDPEARQVTEIFNASGFFEDLKQRYLSGSAEVRESLSFGLKLCWPNGRDRIIASFGRGAVGSKKGAVAA